MKLFSPTHDAFRVRARKFVETRLTPHADEWEREGLFPSSILADLGSEGLLGMTYAREYGGQGLDFAYDIVLAEELPRSRMVGLTLSVLAQNNFCLPLLAKLGTPEQKERFLAPATRGLKIGALQVIEIVQRIVDRCMQLNGAAGFMEQNWIGRAYRDVRVLSLGGGTSEVMKDLVASYLRLG